MIYLRKKNLRDPKFFFRKCLVSIICIILIFQTFLAISSDDYGVGGAGVGAGGAVSAGGSGEASAGDVDGIAASVGAGGVAVSVLGVASTVVPLFRFFFVFLMTV